MRTLRLRGVRVLLQARRQGGGRGGVRALGSRCTPLDTLRTASPPCCGANGPCSPGASRSIQCESLIAEPGTGTCSPQGSEHQIPQAQPGPCDPVTPPWPSTGSVPARLLPVQAAHRIPFAGTAGPCPPRVRARVPRVTPSPPFARPACVGGSEPSGGARTRLNTDLPETP